MRQLQVSRRSIRPVPVKFYLSQSNSWLMAEDHVKEWIEQKLDRGVDPDRIRKTLEKTGRDPDLVDEVQAPFDGEPEEEPDVAEDMEQEDNGEAGKTDNTGQDTEVKDDTGSGEDSGGLDSLKYVDEEEEDNTTERENTRKENTQNQGGSSLSLPSIPVPSFSTPSVNLTGRKLLPLLVIVLVAGLGYGGYQMFGDSLSSSSSTAASHISEALEAECSGELGVGVNIFSVSREDGSTVAEVFTVDEAEVALEIVRGGQVVGQETTVMDGRGTITVQAVGNRVLFHEVGCKDPMVDRDY